jgi:hypothetical protein
MWIADVNGHLCNLCYACGYTADIDANNDEDNRHMSFVPARIEGKEAIKAFLKQFIA